jgi:hypothetical protein
VTHASLSLHVQSSIGVLGKGQPIKDKRTLCVTTHNLLSCLSLNSGHVTNLYDRQRRNDT